MATVKKFHVKRGDEIVVLSGANKGKSGKILEIVADKDRARVEGLAMIKRHEKSREQGKPGKIVEREGTIHVSNLQLKAKYDASKKRTAKAA
ncbi:50S ribosomal protein L24 [Opitutaceae bacterium TAV4]|uniref:50S ribosomal protein L24 n=1 Tax=Geminisphaera colitermitum TaxID=1148786 RepID=UPI000158C9BA|nr:50S ribosomal protein L24 [Geminisphaera colitermitum]RRJ95368.1 50S ribosomal protein L24 [Opitutaceae bacterium TAV4]RRJ99984.1 50S ribosomal protein L24 [Opitutaceae bacterium TAV3]